MRKRFFLLSLGIILFLPSIEAIAEEGFKFSGDLRLRSELDTQRENDASDRFRERIRFRFGIQKEVNEYLTVAARLATGNPDDPNSTHQTMGPAFDRIQFTIDRAYVAFKKENIWAKGGKFAHPFKTPGVYKELVWDQDVQPDGIALGYGLKEEDFSLDIMAAEYLLLEQSNAPEALLTAGQLSLGYNSDPVGLSGGVGGYFYSDPTPAGNTTILDGDNAGNSVDSTSTEFISDFNILDAFLNLTYDADGTPITLSGQFFINLDADTSLSDEDQGFGAGIRIGKTQEPGDFKVYYQYQQVKHDAVFSAFAQDDFPVQTDFKGHLFGITWLFLEKTNLNLWGMLWKKDVDGAENQIRLRADLNLKL